MKYEDFTRKVRRLSYFKTPLLQTFEGEGWNVRTLKNQLVHWQEQGKIHKLKNGIYTLNDEDRRASLPLFLISNLLQTPSYVSMESALSYFGLIPERVGQVIAVTTRKTIAYENFYGIFRYHNMKKDLFFGFETVTEEGLPLLMATPEKAILDKIYFDPSFQADPGYFLEHLRLQNYEDLNTRGLSAFAGRYGPEMKRGAAVLIDLVRKERR